MTTKEFCKKASRHIKGDESITKLRLRWKDKWYRPVSQWLSGNREEINLWVVEEEEFKTYEYRRYPLFSKDLDNVRFSRVKS